MQLFTALALIKPEQFAEECISLDDWEVNAVHPIPSIWKFMSSLGGCTQTGKIYWRMEDTLIVSLLLDGWVRESSPLSKKKSIVVGSPGIGKSTLLCVMAFHLVFKHKKNVLVYRRLRENGQENCLLYLGYEDGKVVQFAVKGCEDHNAINIYEELIRQQGISNVWLLLDGFRYQDIPDGVRTFKLLATSQQVDLKSVERTDAYYCLLPCWSRVDLFSMGQLIHKFHRKDMIKRFYYSGGSVRDFTLATCTDIIEAINDSISSVNDVSNLLKDMSSILTGKPQAGCLRHTFVKNRDALSPLYSNEWWKPFIYMSCWEDIVDSEYAVRCLSLRLRSYALSRIYTWAKNTGNNSLAEAVYEILLHRLAADNQLDLYISEYDPPENYQPNTPRHFSVKQVHLEKHSATCSGTANDHVAHLIEWRDKKNYSYWFPGCRVFRNIDSIAKLKSTSDKKSNVAYLQFTVAAQHSIDSNQLKEMNKIFYPDDVKEAGNIEPPIYIAVCPDLESCKALRLNPAPQVVAAKKVCRVFVGYYVENKYGFAADDRMNDLLLKMLPPSSSHHYVDNLGLSAYKPKKRQRRKR
ncbi:hypothetical protein KXD40_001021 [Peronospora effusa]|uniref:Crinkler (CRN) family protein n=1 Tax=Peronospora effusa TaxID=542832 RepID=A0A3M6VM00_9STRA|nr:hypothetical protein DD238_000740 [Peronospora effusa]RQM17612.1 hypothetical protein DD237_001613 [Peronospora effusa]UIZ20425.1 hypothetical protein KXD40_001021 [Peronospora effusa]CAI5724191.1 unnamed protein product [Peronospora effusa]